MNAPQEIAPDADEGIPSAFLMSFIHQMSGRSSIIIAFTQSRATEKDRHMACRLSQPLQSNAKSTVNQETEHCQDQQ